MKQKLAEKAAAAAVRGDEDEDYDEDAVLDPREKARRDKERELNADLKNAADLLGAAALGGKWRTYVLGTRLTICFRHFFEGARFAHFCAAANEGRLYQALR